VICKLSAAIAKVRLGGDRTSGKTCIGNSDFEPASGADMMARLLLDGEPSGDVRGDVWMVFTVGVTRVSWGDDSLDGDNILSGVGG